MTKNLLTNRQIDSLIVGALTKIGDRMVNPDRETQVLLGNVKKNGWMEDVNILMDVDNQVEIRMKPIH